MHKEFIIALIKLLIMIFQLIVKGTKNSGQIVASSNGYTFIKKIDNRPWRLDRWICTKNHKGCKATLKVVNTGFTKGKKDHDHQPDQGKIEYILGILVILDQLQRY